MKRGLRFAVAATILLGLALGVLQLARRGEQPPSDGDRPDLAGDQPEPLGESWVAVLTRAVNAEWEHTELPTAVGSALPRGRLKLKSGLVQLEFYGGATVILEGPADFELLGTNRGFCRQGKLRARLLPHARGFTIDTPRVNLVDLGTEFGMHINETGGGEVHVFDGKVELHQKGSDQVAPVRQEIAGGRGMRIDPAGALRPTDVRPEAFVGVVELERRATTNLHSRYRAWQAASRKLQADPRVALYYSFEGQERWERTLLHQGPGQPEVLNGAIIGCQWIDGRWPGKRALDFKRPSDRVRINVPGEFAALTLMAWVRIDGFDRLYSSLLLTDGWEEGEPHWKLGDKGILILSVGDKLARHDSPPVLGADKLGQWTHLATVCDGANGRITHYVDGRLVSTGTMRPGVRLRIGNAEIGNWGVPTTASKHPIRNFNGRMDEFILFNQELSADEVQQAFELGKPSS